MNLDEIDIKLRLLAGEPFDVVDVGSVKPLILRQIVRAGYVNFTRMLGIVAQDVKQLDIYDQLNPELRDKLSIFDIVVGVNDPGLNDAFIGALKLFCQTDEVTLVTEKQIFLINGEGILHKDNYLEFQEIIERQCCIYGAKLAKKKDEVEFKPANKKAAEIAAKMKAARESLRKAKAEQEKDSAIDFADIVSAVSTKSNNISKFNVMDLTLYQLYDEFNRLRMVDDYDISIQAMMQGAEKIELKHWSSRIPSSSSE